MYKKILNQLLVAFIIIIAIESFTRGYISYQFLNPFYLALFIAFFSIPLWLEFSKKTAKHI